MAAPAGSKYRAKKPSLKWKVMVACFFFAGKVAFPLGQHVLPLVLVLLDVEPCIIFKETLEKRDEGRDPIVRGVLPVDLGEVKFLSSSSSCGIGRGDKVFRQVYLGCCGFICIHRCVCAKFQKVSWNFHHRGGTGPREAVGYDTMELQCVVKVFGIVRYGSVFVEQKMRSQFGVNGVFYSYLVRVLVKGRRQLTATKK
jgi:hypothetical protein